jgi:hypothetical protein
MTSDRIGDVHAARDGHVATVTTRMPPHYSVSVELMRDLANIGRLRKNMKGVGRREAAPAPGQPSAAASSATRPSDRAGAIAP